MFRTERPTSERAGPRATTHRPVPPHSTSVPLLDPTTVARLGRGAGNAAVQRALTGRREQPLEGAAARDGAPVVQRTLGDAIEFAARKGLGTFTTEDEIAQLYLDRRIDEGVRGELWAALLRPAAQEQQRTKRFRTDDRTDPVEVKDTPRPGPSRSQGSEESHSPSSSGGTFADLPPEKEERHTAVDPSGGWQQLTDEYGTSYLVTTLGHVTWWYDVTHKRFAYMSDAHAQWQGPWEESYRGNGYEPPPVPSSHQPAETSWWNATSPSDEKGAEPTEEPLDDAALRWERDSATTLTEGRYGLTYYAATEPKSKWQKARAAQVLRQDFSVVKEKAVLESALAAYLSLPAYKPPEKKEKSFRDSYHTFQEGDLVYGVNEDRDAYLRPVRDTKLPYEVIDDLNAQFLGTETGLRYGARSSQASHDQRVVDAAKSYRSALETHLRSQDKMFSEDDKGPSAAAVNRRVTRSIKFGLTYTTKTKQRTIRFILDGIDMDHVVDPAKSKKHYADFTSKELRSLYRRRKDHELMSQVVFILHGSEVDPPWITDAQLWEGYEPKSERSSRQ